jgi:1-acyl-sn-glycerol-3-phosphate acyltransferase
VPTRSHPKKKSNGARTDEARADVLTEETRADEAQPDDATVVESGARSHHPPKPMTVDEVSAQIRKLETKLDRMIQRSRKKGAREADRAPADEAAGVTEPSAPLSDATANAAAGEVLSSDYYAKQWGRTALRSRAEDVDEFGLDPKYAARAQPLFDFLYKHYFRVETVGAPHIPDEGRCLVVANHSGTFPYDGVMLKTAMLHAHSAKREMRWLAEDFIFYLPFVGAFMNRIGAVRACQENAERLLGQERLVGVFPEGIKGIGKLYRERYKLQRFGRGGFIRLCLRTETPIVPCAIVGAEESSPMLLRLEYLANLFGARYLPITPTFPALGPLGLVPAPTKWRIEFGEPIRFDGYGPEAADDSLLVGRLTERVRSTIQAMLDRGVADRQSIWFG